MAPISKILVAIDFSECSNRALSLAVELSGQLGATIDVVHAFVSPVPTIYVAEIGNPDSLVGDARIAAKKMLEAASDKAHATSATVRTHLVEGPAAGAIASVAKEIEADLVIVGSHGHSGLKHVLMGSVAEHTVRESPCSVLVVK